ncbi:MAG: hypothetical protein LBQ22_07010 [Bacteroidales bacterium]|jgi:ubiquitin-protein ligase|nr:hypothetical protein [Bacteroidales bacterium]
MSGIDSYDEKNLSGRSYRLFKEWKAIDKRFKNDDKVEYIIRKPNGDNLPVEYDIFFHIKSITGVREKNANGLQEPIFGNEHVMRIKLPNSFPAGRPEFKFKTDVWHPNIRYFGDFKGNVCLNITDHGTFVSLADYIDRVIEYLKYEDYFAINEYPYPEDLEVAEWVIKQAEPNNWLKFKQDQ